MLSAGIASSKWPIRDDADMSSEESSPVECESSGFDDVVEKFSSTSVRVASRIALSGNKNVNYKYNVE